MTIDSVRVAFCSRAAAWLTIVLALLLTSLPGWSQQNPPGKPLVLRGATLIDGTGKAPVPDAVIVIQGDRVKAAGGKSTPAPADATVIDLQGKYIIPGLVDSHTHYQSWMGELLLNHGITSAFIIGSRDSVGEQYYRDSRRADVRTPRIYDAGPALRLLPSQTREEVHDLVQAWLKTKPDFGKLPSYSKRTQQQYQWAAEEIHNAGLAIIGHSEDCLGAIRAGLDVVEHLWGCAKSVMTLRELEGFEKGEHLHWGLFFKDQARNDALIKEAVQRGVYLNPTLLYEFSSQTPLAQQFELDSFNVYKNDALMTYFPQNLTDALMAKFRMARSYSTKYGTQVRVAHLTEKERQESKDAYRWTEALVKRWVELGGKILGGSDTPSIGTSGLGLHLEMSMFVESGLTPMQVLQSETLWGAEMLTARRKPATRPDIGIVAEGAYADLVVLNANPLDKIQNARKIDRVMKGGQFVKLGYTPAYSSNPGLVRSTPYVLEPEISAILPNRVTEGIPEFEMTVDGEGFLPDSVVRVDGIAVPTTFANIRTLKARIPASMVAQAVPDRFMLNTNPEQATGVYGDRTLKVTVFTGPPDGGLSNSVSLKVMAKWMEEEK